MVVDSNKILEKTKEYFLSSPTQDNILWRRTKYIVECFSNGCMSYSDFIYLLSLFCGKSEDTMYGIFDFGNKETLSKKRKKKLWKQYILQSDMMQGLDFELMMFYLEMDFNCFIYDNEIEMSSHTNGGVEMPISIQVEQEFPTKKMVLLGLKSYIDSFNIDDEIDLYRQDKNYKRDFTISESVKDFKSYIKEIKKLYKKYKNL